MTTSSSLKVSDRWTALVGDDPYAAKEKPTDNMMQKMWADPRLHGNQKKIGSNDDGSAIFAGARPQQPPPPAANSERSKSHGSGGCTRVDGTSARFNGRRDGGSACVAGFWEGTN